MTQINLMAGGPSNPLPDDWAQEPGVWAGIDRGTLRLLQAGITPVFSVGDYDSLTEAEYTRVTEAVPEHVRYAPEKDYTDTQLAMAKALALPNVETIHLFGATGGRLDHALANLYLPLTPDLTAATTRLAVIDRDNWIEYLTAATGVYRPQPGYRYFGVVCLTPVTGLTIRGAKYPLTNWSSTLPFSWASNEFVGATPISISVQAGALALIYSRDTNGQKLFN